jgi:hypothetical protein
MKPAKPPAPPIQPRTYTITDSEGNVTVLTSTGVNTEPLEREIVRRLQRQEDILAGRE